MQAENRQLIVFCRDSIIKNKQESRQCALETLLPALRKGRGAGALKIWLEVCFMREHDFELLEIRLEEIKKTGWPSSYTTMETTFEYILDFTLPAAKKTRAVRNGKK